MYRPLILVTNDDGINAKGIHALVSFVQPFGDLVIVAPNAPQSAQGHAITIRDPLRVYRSEAFANLPGVEAWECSGTPVDCVKLAKQVVLKNRHIDICVSGINHGSNASINIIYSGTMSAAMEAALEGIKAIGFSLCDFSHHADFSPAKEYVQQMVQFVLSGAMQDCNLLNVNIPKRAAADIKGIKICRQANARWVEEFKESIDPYGQPYYWLTGKFVNEDEGEDSDEYALAQGYVSVVPCHYDLTKYDSIQSLKMQLEHL